MTIRHAVDAMPLSTSLIYLRTSPPGSFVVFVEEEISARSAREVCVEKRPEPKGERA